ncbi:MAG: DUF2478 domain-containing protein, partial [Bacteroidales bacterium]|nr:DUF2478 domain-containing protein [Bacteroidales bacterium]
TGSQGEGKTAFVKKLIGLLNENGIKTGGILSERVMTGTETTGYDIVNISTGERSVFLRRDEDFGYEKIGRFSINPAGLEAGIAALESSAAGRLQIIIVDEVGRLELQGRGWTQELDRLLKVPGCNIMISVRDVFVDQVKEKWELADALTISISDLKYSEAAESIIKAIRPAP